LGDCGNQLVSLKRAVFSDPIGDVVLNDPNDEASLVSVKMYCKNGFTASISK
jgi:hypothetical protein